MTLQVLHTRARMGSLLLAMIPQSRRDFLKNLTLAGAAVFTARHIKAIELDATEPKDPGIIVGPYRKSWQDLYAEESGDGYRLSVNPPNDDFQGMTWREVFEANGQDDLADAIERFNELQIDYSYSPLEKLECDNDELLAAFAAAGGTAADPSEPPNWREVLELLEPDLIQAVDEAPCGSLSRVNDLDEICYDWYDRVGPFHTPEGEAYLEVVELLDSIKEVDDDLYDAARDCFEIIEGSAPGNDYHGVYVQSRENLGILRRILHAADIKVNILVV